MRSPWIPWDDLWAGCWGSAQKCDVTADPRPAPITLLLHPYPGLSALPSPRPQHRRRCLISQGVPLFLGVPAMSRGLMERWGACAKPRGQPAPSFGRSVELHAAPLRRAGCISTAFLAAKQRNLNPSFAEAQLAASRGKGTGLVSPNLGTARDASRSPRCPPGDPDLPSSWRREEGRTRMGPRVLVQL